MTDENRARRNIYEFLKQHPTWSTSANWKLIDMRLKYLSQAQFEFILKKWGRPVYAHKEEQIRTVFGDSIK